MAKDPGEIRQEVEATRDALAGTIQALGDKADIKGRVAGAVQDGARTAKDQVVGTVSEARSRLSNLTTDPAQPLLGSNRAALAGPAGDLRILVPAAMAALLLVLLVARRRRKKRRSRA